MANDYFTRTFDVAPGSRVGSQAVEDQFELIEQGFEKMPSAQAIHAGQGNYAVAGGAADVYTLAMDAEVVALSDGLTATVKFPTALANATTTPTINVNSLGAKSIVRQNGSAVAIGDLVGVVILTYNTTAGKFMQVSGAGLASEAAAAASAAAALVSEGAASDSADDAATALSNAQAVYDAFDDRFLGAKASDPTLDNDGNALITGALYFNTTAGEMRAYSGSAWQVTYSPGTSASQAEAEAGTEVALRAWSPLRVAQAISVLGRTNLVRTARTSNTILGVADKGGFTDATSGTWTQTFSPAATLGSGWNRLFLNSGIGVITLDPNGAETIDGLASFEMYPGEVRLIQCDGAALRTVVLHPFKLEPAATMTFIEPPGYKAYEVFLAAPGGGGGSGRRGAAGTARAGGGAGSGGGSAWAIIKAVTPGASITLTVGANGTGGAAIAADDTNGNAGTAGGNHSFGSTLSAIGGAAGAGGLAGATAGGTAVAVGAGQIVAAGTNGGGGQDASGVVGTAATTWASTGGGGGGAVDSANTGRDGAAGGASGTASSATQLAGGTAGTTAGTRPGGDGNSSAAQRGGSGGGGGAGHASAAGAAGGNGKRGGGGGGGSGSLNGAASGAGGNGEGYYYVGGIV